MFTRRVRSGWQSKLWIVLFTLLLTAGLGFVLSSELLLSPRLAVQEGQAAGQDIVAPTRIEYVSDIATQARRQSAAAAVSDIYDPLDRQVGQQQSRLALQILSFIESVRSDPFASPDYARYCLEQIQNISLSTNAISHTLNLNEEEWKAVQLETRRVLEEVMRREIREGQEEVRRREVRSLISFDLNEAQTTVVEDLVSDLVRANRTYNASQTEAARRAAMESIPLQIVSLEQNEIIVRNGEIVTPEKIEALEKLGLLAPRVDWLLVSSTGLFALSLSAATALYIWHNERELVNTPQHLLLILLLLISFAFIFKSGAIPPISQPFLVPIGTLAMLVTALFNVRIGLLTHAVICLVIGYIANGQLDILWYALAGGLMGILAMRRINQVSTFIWAGGYVTLANLVTMITFAALTGGYGTLRLGQLLLAGAANGALSAILTLGGYYALGFIFQITTSLQLMDLARPTHPLLRALLLKAPGTYHHSIMVGNMAEQAAEAIGADALLSRVGAYYHDIGKIARPYFFTENQMDGANPHDLLDPETSAQIIRSHTADGLVLAQKYHLPQELKSFIAEHHGTSTIWYFYHKASQEQRQVLEERFKYDGPRPMRRETAIVMMADTCEAAVRSAHPHNAQELEKLIRHLVAKKISSGELDQAPLTLREIETITLSFIDTLQGVFHPRISYPPEKERTDNNPPAAPLAPSAPEPEHPAVLPESPAQAVALDVAGDGSTCDPTQEAQHD